MGSTAVTTFLVYLLTVVVFMLVVVMIKDRMATFAKHDSKGTPSGASVSAGNAADGEIAAIAAAVAAVLGGSFRIVHIESTGRGSEWKAVGRMMHQMSRAVPRRSPSKSV